MNYEVDVKQEYLLAKSKYFKISLLFSSIFTLVIVSDVLMITLTKENYVPFLIISIIITILFVWFAFFFFTNTYKDINGRYRYFQGYEKGLKSEDLIIFEKLDKEMVYLNGVYVYPIKVSFLSNLDEPEEKTIYTFSSDLHFKRGDKLSIKTYQRILVSAELTK